MAPLTNQIAVIPNPAVKDTPTGIPDVPDSVKNNSHIHLKFGVTGNRNLSLQVYDTTNIDNPTPYQDNGARTGVIHEPGTLAGAIHNNIAVVYGIAAYGGADTKLPAICKLSPYYNPLLNVKSKTEPDTGPITTNMTSLTACGDGDQDNRIYYLKNIGDDTNPNIALIELEVLPRDQVEEKVLEPNYKPGFGSRLTSFYESRPYVFFVHNDDGERGIYYVSATQSKSAYPIPDTVMFKDKTPLAIVTNASTVDANQIFLQLTLYYVNFNGYLSYALGTLKRGQMIWESATQSLEDIQVDQTSGLSVISGADNKTHYIYLVPKGDGAGAYSVYTATPWQRAPKP